MLRKVYVADVSTFQYIHTCFPLCIGFSIIYDDIMVLRLVYFTIMKGTKQSTVKKSTKKHIVEID